METKTVQAELKEMYCFNHGHDGWTNGCGYDGRDKWEETYYGETPDELAKIVGIANFNGIHHASYSEFSKVLLLIYEDTQHVHKTLAIYNSYDKKTLLADEYKAFHDFLIYDEELNLVRKTLSEAAEKREKSEREAQAKIKEEEKKLADIKLYEEIKKRHNL